MREMRKTLDLLADAVRDELSPSPSYSWARVFFSMTVEEREQFDKFLVDTKDPLAWQAGTCEYRFRMRVKQTASSWRFAPRHWPGIEPHELGG